jgi:hypothetical protein
VRALIILLYNKNITSECSFLLYHNKKFKKTKKSYCKPLSSKKTGGEVTLCCIPRMRCGIIRKANKGLLLPSPKGMYIFIITIQKQRSSVDKFTIKRNRI